MATGRALDIANWTKIPTAQELDCAKQQGYDRLIVGVSYGNVGSMQLAAGRDAGMELEAYVWLKHPFVLHEAEMIRAFNQIAGLPVKRLWIDVEDVATASAARVAQQVEDVWQAIKWWQKQRPDLPLGIYTAKWWWSHYMPNITEDFGLPLWVAYYPNVTPEKADLEAYLPGGWALHETILWQYAGSVDTCGLNTDRNIVLLGDERMKYTDQVLDATFGAILKDLGYKGALIASLGNGLGKVAQDLYTHIYNNGDFTRPQMEQLERLQAEIEAINQRTAKFIADVQAAGAAFHDN